LLPDLPFTINLQLLHFSLQGKCRGKEVAGYFCCISLWIQELEKCFLAFLWQSKGWPDDSLLQMKHAGKCIMRAASSIKTKNMKRLSVLVPCILLASLLIYSFVQKEKDAAKVITNKKAVLNAVFKSRDGGQTWQDIGQGLPANLRENGIRGDSIFANDKGLLLWVGNEVYHSRPNATAHFWTKETFNDSHLSGFKQPGSMAPGKSGMFASEYWGANLKKANGTIVWSPLFDNSGQPGIRSAFETSGGTVFIGTNEGIFKTENDGTSWKQVYAGGYVGHLAELDGVLLATGMRRILRSTDDGENWALVTSDSSVVFDVKQVNGGFAAMTSTSESNPRGVRTSYDAGLTWQTNHAGNKVTIDSIARTWNNRPNVKVFMTSVSRVGKNLFCIHNEGIFKSSDEGKTWTLLLPSVNGKPFNLFGSGNEIYAIPSRGGC
jgi:photosystem II stability/assembly factor-like uncharacterized protein